MEISSSVVPSREILRLGILRKERDATQDAVANGEGGTPPPCAKRGINPLRTRKGTGCELSPLV